MLRVLITGGDGQLGRAITTLVRGSANQYTAATIEDMDITNEESVMRMVAGYDIVINCAAYTNVEEAEENETAADMVNNRGVAIVAKACKRLGARLIHISTDYVFGGDTTRSTPYNEEDAPAPINAYGRTKAAGEQAAIEHGGIVIRTSWLYSPWGKNFCLTILRHAATKRELHVVDDQRGTPTSALSLARAIIAIIEGGIVESMQGIYHYTDLGEATWHEFATEIARMGGYDTAVRPCTSEEYPTKAERPAYSVLAKRRIEAIKEVELRPWQEALSEVIALIKS